MGLIQKVDRVRERNGKTELRESIRWHATYSLGRTNEDLSPVGYYAATALALRDRIIDIATDWQKVCRTADSKYAYYLSMEFLVGRSLENNLINLGLYEECRTALHELGVDLSDIVEMEPDAALGNGGLGRLAACFMDSLSTLGLPAWGYGINYEYGLFRQEMRDGRQVEKPDSWLIYGFCPWQVERPEQVYVVGLYGHVEQRRDRGGNSNAEWIPRQKIVGVPHDFPIVGYGGNSVNYVRLFSARASDEFDMQIFNDGDFIRAVEIKVSTETISKVLYPSDQTHDGRELRLVQEYFLVACAIRDIIRRVQREDFAIFADKVAIQLNDTHPSLSVAELMRMLVDEYRMPWEQAWDITTRALSYTNHTLMPEALERWPVDMFERVLPRHMQIIYEINRRFLDQVARIYPGDLGKIQRMSLVEEGPVKQVRMANLAIVGGHAVNGVSRVHSQLVREELFPDFATLWPEKFQNKTNGITPRRWLRTCNAPLASLITEALGESWVNHLDELRNLAPLAEDAGFREKFRAAQSANRTRLIEWIASTPTLGFACDPEAVIDTHVKRIHEYKRQLLNVLHMVHEYLRIVEDGYVPAVPRVKLFAGKAAPSYTMAKRIIHLINTVGKQINNDPKVRDTLKVVFAPDYRVTLAEMIIPASTVSEQISTAGTEASGTSNMKFALNGALTVGTLDGANIEIRDAVGPDNFFLFGHTVDEVRALRQANRHPREYYLQNPMIQRILNAFRDGRLFPRQSDQQEFRWVYHKLVEQWDPYFHLADLVSYLEAHDRIMSLAERPDDWTRKAILNVAHMGQFSSDRTIAEYARDIWHVSPPPVPPVPSPNA